MDDKEEVTITDLIIADTKAFKEKLIARTEAVQANNNHLREILRGLVAAVDDQKATNSSFMGLAFAINDARKYLNVSPVETIKMLEGDFKSLYQTQMTPAMEVIISLVHDEAGRNVGNDKPISITITDMQYDELCEEETQRDLMHPFIGGKTPCN